MIANIFLRRAAHYLSMVNLSPTEVIISNCYGQPVDAVEPWWANQHDS